MKFKRMKEQESSDSPSLSSGDEYVAKKSQSKPRAKGLTGNERLKKLRSNQSETKKLLVNIENTVAHTESRARLPGTSKNKIKEKDTKARSHKRFQENELEHSTRLVEQSAQLKEKRQSKKVRENDSISETDSGVNSSMAIDSLTETEPVGKRARRSCNSSASTSSVIKEATDNGFVSADLISPVSTVRRLGHSSITMSRIVSDVAVTPSEQSLRTPADTSRNGTVHDNQPTSSRYLTVIDGTSIVTDNSIPVNLVPRNFFKPTYFERQVAAFCALHVINNALHGKFVNKRTLDLLARENQSFHMALEDDMDYNESIQHDVDGNYNIDIISRAMIELGLNVTGVSRSMRQELSVSVEPCVIIVGNRSHYYALRRFEFGAPLYLLNSLLRGPRIVNNNVFMSIPELHTLIKIDYPLGRDLSNYLPSLNDTHEVGSNPNMTGTAPNCRPAQSGETSLVNDLRARFDGTSPEEDLMDLDAEEFTFNDVKASFGPNVERWHLLRCKICKASKLYSHSTPCLENFSCNRCVSKRSNPNHYFGLPCHTPQPMPAALRNFKLTFVEEQLISLVFVNQYVYVRGRGGEYATKGHCISFAQDVSAIAEILPKVAQELPIVIVRKTNVLCESLDLKVRRAHVEYWLRWLKANSPLPGYRNLIISENNLNLLPEDGYLQQLRTVETMDEISPDFNLQAHNQNDLTNETSELASSMQRSCSLHEMEAFPEVEEDGNPHSDSGIVLPPVQPGTESEMISEAMNRAFEVQSANPNIQTPIIPFPAHSSEPLSEYNTPFLASMAFPTLFPLGTGDPFAVHARHDEYSFIELVRYLINYTEQINGKLEFRFARHSRFVLFIYNIFYRHRALSQSKYYLQQNSHDANLTIDQLRDMINNGCNSVLKNIQRYMANIPGTPSYWHKSGINLRAIIKDKGPPHLFFTFSFADFHDPYLHELLGIPAGSSKPVIAQYLKEYPHIANHFFVVKFTEFKIVWMEKRWKGTPEHGGWVWYRFEWQFRGAIHVHGLLRLGGNRLDTYDASAKAIVGQKLQLSRKTLTKEEQEVVALGIECEKKLIDFHDSLICADASETLSEYRVRRDRNSRLPMALKYTDIPEEECECDLLALTYILEQHGCRVNACTKVFNNVIQPCKLGMPKPLSEHTSVVYTQERLKNGQLGELLLSIVPKRLNDNRILNHNTEALELWRGNCELSLCHDLRRVVKYVSKYASKPETNSGVFQSVFKKVFERANSNTTSTHLALQQVMTKVLAERDVTVHEALHQLMGLDLQASNITVVTTSLEPTRAIQRNGSGEAVLHEAYIDLYAGRAKFSDKYPDIDSLNFVSFAKKFDSKLKAGKLVERRNTCHYSIRIVQSFSSVHTNDKYWLYCKYELLRYKPWSGFASSVLGSLEVTEVSWIRAWYAFLLTDVGKCYVPVWNDSFAEAQAFVEANDGEDDVDEFLNHIDVDNDGFTMQEDWHRVQSDREVRATDLLSDQNVDPAYWAADRLLFDEATLACMENFVPFMQQQGEGLDNNALRPLIDVAMFNEEQARAYRLVRRSLRRSQRLLLRLEGEGGTGKSFVINAMCNLLQNGQTDVCRHAVVAFTGKAANLVGGCTLHNLLMLNPNSTSMGKNLEGGALRQLQDRFSAIDFLITDEYSQIGCKMLALIDRRLRQAKNCPDLFFGGISVVLVGDPKQLPPIGDSVLFNKDTLSKDDEVFQGLAAYHAFTNVILLVRNNRVNSPGEEIFRQLLSRLRDGKSSIADWEVLSTRIKGIAVDTADFKDALYIMYTNIEVNEYNYLKLGRLNMGENPQMSCRIDAVHNCPLAQTIKSDDLNGLQPFICMARNARVMVIHNVWTPQGITNGAVGTIRHIIFPVGVWPPNLPSAVIVEMDEGYTGAHIPNMPRFVAINPRIANTFSGRHFVERKQVPIRLAFACTIHKVQGATLDKICVRLGKSEPSPNMTYVALSRPRTLGGLLIDREFFDASRLTSIVKPRYVGDFDRETLLLNEQTRLECIRDDQLEVLGLLS